VEIPDERVEVPKEEVQGADGIWNNENEDGEITGHARELRRLEQFQQEIMRL
jgi:hypothetical protein